MDHLDQLIPDMGSPRHPVVFGSQRSRSDQNIAHPHLAAAVTLAVVTGKAFDQCPAEPIFAAHEDILIRDKEILEDHQGFMPPELPVAHIDGSAFQFAGVTGLPPVDMQHPLGIRGRCKAEGIIGILRPHGDGRHDQ